MENMFTHNGDYFDAFCSTGDAVFIVNETRHKLNISQFTARNHIQNILAKLDLHSKTQAVSYAFKKGLL